MEKTEVTSPAINEMLGLWLKVANRAALIAAALLCITVVSPAVAAESAGVLLAVTGKVEIAHGTAKRPATNHGELYSGDTITTEDGQAQIRFADGTLLTLYRNTKFSVDDYHYGHGNGDRAQFSLLSGLMHTLTGLIDKRSYQLTTRLATLGVRGTEYSVQLDNALHVSVDQGKVALANAGGSVLVGAGQSVVITGPNVMPPPSNGGRINLGMHGPGARPGGHGGGPGAGAAPPPPPPPPPGTAKF